MKISAQSFLPTVPSIFPKSNSPVAIIANGEFELNNQALIQKIMNCQQIIAADGGLNHCKKAGITPNLIIGDLDSVEPSLIEKYPKAHVIKLNSRAKDKTDLEEALQHAKISEVAQVIIVGGLGNRVDHSLANIFLLLRYPGKLFLQTSKEIIFALNDTIKNFELECTPNQILTLIPMYGSAKNINILSENGHYYFPHLNDEKTTFSTKPLGKKFRASIAQGEVICILSEKEHTEKELTKIGTISCSFRLDQPLAKTLELIRHVCLYPYHSCIETDNEILFVLNEYLAKWTIPQMYKSKIFKGTTISLFPFNGPAEATVNGLKWQGKLSFTKDFLGISNVALTPSFTIQVSKGIILCIVNKYHIDSEMIGLEDRTSTAKYDSHNLQKMIEN